MNVNKSYLITENIKSIFSLERVSTIFGSFSSKSTKIAKTESPYGNMLRESRKLSLLYGNLSKKYLQRIFQKSRSSPSRTRENIFSILESRLDIVLYRAGFFDSIVAARQMIRSGRIKVNRKKVISSGYIVVPGDIVHVCENKNELELLHKKRYHFSRKSINLLLSHNKAIENAASCFTANTDNPSRPHQFLIGEGDTKIKKTIEPSAEMLFSLHTRAPSVSRLKKSSISSTKSKKGNKIGWRFKASFLVLSLVKREKITLLITLVNKALNLLDSKKKIEFHYKKERFKETDSLNHHFLSSKLENNRVPNPSEKKKNITDLVKFNNDNILNKIDYLQNKSLFLFLPRKSLSNFFLNFLYGDKNPFKLLYTESNARFLKKSRISDVREPFFYGKTHFDKKKERPSLEFIKKVNKTSSQRNTESRIAKQLPFLFFYKNKKKEKSLTQIPVSSFYDSFQTLKKKEIVKTKNYSFISDNFDKNFALSNIFIFSNYLVSLRKQFLSSRLKNDCFLKQKKQSFFKNQTFFEFKKAKPLHLEVSYRSLSIVFLFPPQRICFPSFINLSLIFK